MDYNFVIKPLVGAVIGYSTNWLAIKMLFRPHEEKKIGGLKVPFTPGVIPRERERIARSLGGAVGQQLLTEEVISKELLNDKVTAHIRSYVIDELLERDLSLDELLQVVLGANTDSVYEGVTMSIVTELGMYLNNPVTTEVLRKEITGYLSDMVPYESTIGILISDRMVTELEGAVRNNIEGINAYLLSLANSEGVRNRLAGAIETMVMEKVGAFGAMFLDGPSMAASGIRYLENLLEEDQVKEGIISAVGEGIGQVRQKNISETISVGLYAEAMKGVTDKILGAISAFGTQERLHDSVKPMVVAMAGKKIHLSQDQKGMIEGQVEVLYRQFIEKNIKTFLESFEVSRIVEDEINRFSVMDIEKLIFGIIDKELSAITWLGGLLGFIIGLVYLVL